MSGDGHFGTAPHHESTGTVEGRDGSGRMGPTRTSYPGFQVRADSTQYANPHAHA